MILNSIRKYEFPCVYSKYTLIPGLRGIAKNDTLRVAARQNK
jgi:hypothetical protein